MPNAAGEDRYSWIQGGLAALFAGFVVLAIASMKFSWGITGLAVTGIAAVSIASWIVEYRYRDRPRPPRLPDPPDRWRRPSG